MSSLRYPLLAPRATVQSHRHPSCNAGNGDPRRWFSHHRGTCHHRVNGQKETCSPANRPSKPKSLSSRCSPLIPHNFRTNCYNRAICRKNSANLRIQVRPRSHQTSNRMLDSPSPNDLTELSPGNLLESFNGCFSAVSKTLRGVSPPRKSFKNNVAAALAPARRTWKGTPAHLSQQERWREPSRMPDGDPKVGGLRLKIQFHTMCHRFMQPAREQLLRLVR